MAGAYPWCRAAGPATTTQCSGEPSISDADKSHQPRRWRLWLLGLLIAGALAFAVIDPIDRGEALAWGEALADNPWTAVVVVLVQIVLFALGLPGSLMVWLIAPFYAPLVSTLLMLVGSVIGAMLAYLIAGYLGESVHRRLHRQRTFRLLTRHSDFFTQAALRVLPGFPHGVVNYAAGVLHLRWLSFLLAAILGLAVKWAVYSWAIHSLFARGLEREGPGAGALLPLVLLTAFLGLGSLIAARMKNRRNAEHE